MKAIHLIFLGLHIKKALNSRSVILTIKKKWQTKLHFQICSLFYSNHVTKLWAQFNDRLVQFNVILFMIILKHWQGYIFWPFPPKEELLSKLKNREELEGGLEKRKGKGGKEENKEKSDKTHVKIPL